MYFGDLCKRSEAADLGAFFRFKLELWLWALVQMPGQEEKLTQVCPLLVSPICLGDNDWAAVWCVSPLMETSWSNQGEALGHLAPPLCLRHLAGAPCWYRAKQDQPQGKIVPNGGRFAQGVAIWARAPALQSHLCCEMFCSLHDKQMR